MKCPNCGREIQGDRCPYCGYSTRAGGGNRAAAVIVAVLLVLPCAAFGACSVYVTAASLPLQGQGGVNGAIFSIPLLVVSLSGLVGLCLWVRKLWKG